MRYHDWYKGSGVGETLIGTKAFTVINQIYLQFIQMFHLQQKYKRTFHKMQTRKQVHWRQHCSTKGGRQGKHRDRKVMWAGPQNGVSPGVASAGSTPQASLAHVHCALCWSRQKDDRWQTPSSFVLWRLGNRLSCCFTCLKVIMFLFLQIQNILAQFNSKC